MAFQVESVAKRQWQISRSQVEAQAGQQLGPFKHLPTIAGVLGGKDGSVWTFAIIKNSSSCVGAFNSVRTMTSAGPLTRIID